MLGTACLLNAFRNEYCITYYYIARIMESFLCKTTAPFDMLTKQY